MEEVLYSGSAEKEVKKTVKEVGKAVVEAMEDMFPLLEVLQSLGGVAIGIPTMAGASEFMSGIKLATISRFASGCTVTATVTDSIPVT